MASPRDTKERLIQSAVTLFARKWYGTVSVAEICREAGLSNGVFYRYFAGKEELFKSILDSIRERAAAALASVGGADREERLAAFAGTLLRSSALEPELESVFREGQYRFIEYERELAELYRQGLGRILGAEIGLPAYLFALGGLRFCAARAALQGIPIREASALAILRGGLFPGQRARAELVFAGPVQPLPLPAEEGSADCLLRSGKRLFGSKGFFETNIHEITDLAGLSVGAFYTHFASKEAFYARLIGLAGREIRRFISSNLPEGLNRLERELRGLWLFALYLQQDKHCYRLVREAEFVLPAEVRAYYGSFVEGYRRRPLAAEGLAPGLDETTAIEFLLGVNHHLGIETAFSGASGGLRARIEALGPYLAEGLSPYLR
ncbi:MAG TPA: TetR/AcrR family transcriptional regulator [Spirochaetales bacterium]|nr:TetR/AcrR family transcriptional regulator [Spirochaetales bacterium]HRY55715.1 TetR/AcrR family transcriptional regulator [Spirochaetia bacterium]HRZ65824.1 TetR/AcrR family transcriptional regulator [Spirochaetia bacterium]